MSGTMRSQLLAPDKAARLLEDVIYERVLGCIDLEELFMIEAELFAAVSACDADEDESVRMAIAKEMIDRALRRLPNERRRYETPPPLDFDCPDCEEEALEHAKRRQGGRVS